MEQMRLGVLLITLAFCVAISFTGYIELPNHYTINLAETLQIETLGAQGLSTSPQEVQPNHISVWNDMCLEWWKVTNKIRGTSYLIQIPKCIL